MKRGHAKRNSMSGMTDPALLSDEMLDAEMRALIAAQDLSARRWACDRPNCNGLPHKGWKHRHARASQRPPAWSWRTWMLLTGRGWGKTRTAAELVRKWAAVPNQQICVLAKKETLVREICFEHRRSGLLRVIPPEEIAKYNSSTGDVHLTLKNGSVIRGFGTEVPDNLRGWEFDKGWADEYAAWSRKTAQEAMDMLWFCLRESEEPQVVISTTPKPLPHIIKLVERSKKQTARIREAEENGTLQPGDGPKVVIVTGHTHDNRANLSDAALEELDDSYANTRLGQQELDGLVLEDVEGALWHAWVFEADGFRVDRPDVPELERVVVAVDPATTTTETADETGFAVVGRSGWQDASVKDQRPRGYVLHSEATKLTPVQTMTRAAALYHKHKADAVVLEVNNGGDYLGTVLQMVDPSVVFRVVNASRGKRARATPVAALYEQERFHHVGPAAEFDELEKVQTTYVGAAESEEKSPDILDALVWAAWDLFLDPRNVSQMRQPSRDGRSDGRR